MVAVVFTFPLQLFPVTLELDLLLCGLGGSHDDQNAKNSRRGNRDDKKKAISPSNFCGLVKGDAVRVVVVFLAWCAAVVGRESLDRIVALVGALCGAPISLVVPFVLHNSVLKKEAALQAARSGTGKSGVDLYLNNIFIGIGVVLTVGTTASVIYTWNED